MIKQNYPSPQYQQQEQRVLYVLCTILFSLVVTFFIIIFIVKTKKPQTEQLQNNAISFFCTQAFRAGTCNEKKLINSLCCLFISSILNHLISRLAALLHFCIMEKCVLHGQRYSKLCTILFKFK